MGLIDFWNILFNQIKRKKTKPRRKTRPRRSKIRVKSRVKKSFRPAVRKPSRKAALKTGAKKRTKTVNRTKKRTGEVRKQKKSKRRLLTGKAVKKNIRAKKNSRPRPPATKTKLPSAILPEEEIGVITHYFNKISVGIVKLKRSLAAGDTIHIKGAHDDFRQVVSSMQINRIDVKRAGKNDEIGIRVVRPVHENDRVYKISNPGRNNG